MLKRFFISMLGSLTAIWISIMLLIVLAMTFAIGSIVNALSVGKSQITVSDNSILCINLDRSIEERISSPDFYSMINKRPQPADLSNTLNAIAAAADDDNVKGIFLKCEGASAGIATRDAIREAIEKFRDSGKWVVAYGDNYTQGDYYIATSAKEIYLNPIGSVDLKGLGAGIPFFKNLLDKVGVEMQVVKVGTFKSAVEPYVMTGMSEANRFQTQAYIDNMWNYMVGQIAESRNISAGSINMLADSVAALTPASELLSAGIVDGLKYGNEMTDYLKELSGKSSDDDLSMVSVGEYIASGVQIPGAKSEKHKIAVYYASGDITENGDKGIASDRVVPDILKLAKDDDIDALVLRVNSGGGSAFASEQIWHALEVFKSEGKPFYVSMGDYAASGGYYISCGAEMIFASPLTLTGSIGIFGLIPNAKELLNDKIGINFDFVTTNANTATLNIQEPMTPFLRRRLQEEINRGYELFTNRCAEGRGMSQDSIKAIAEGRVWDGTTALKIGLVDELGSLNDAVNALAKKEGYKKYQVIAYPNPNAAFWDIIMEFSVQMRTNALKDELGVYYPLYEEVKNLRDIDPVQARMETLVVE